MGLCKCRLLITIKCVKYVKFVKLGRSSDILGYHQSPMKNSGILRRKMSRLKIKKCL